MNSPVSKSKITVSRNVPIVAVTDVDFCCGLQSPEDWGRDSPKVLPSSKRGPLNVSLLAIYSPLATAFHRTAEASGV